MTTQNAAFPALDEGHHHENCLGVMGGNGSILVKYSEQPERG